MMKARVLALGRKDGAALLLLQPKIRRRIATALSSS
jgi:hypothetical protein